MPKNSTKILLLLTLVGGMLISISSNSWLGVWMGLEINLLSFIPMMIDKKNMYTMEASLKYFLIQALASSTLIFLIIFMMIIIPLPVYAETNYPPSSLIIIPLMLKGGAAPLHWWFPGVMEGLNWMNCFILMTIQKTSPMILMSYIIKLDMLALIFIISSVIIGAMGGFNQTSTRKILTYSSINHIGWMLSAILMGINTWLIYFTFYSILILSIVLTFKNLQMSFINQSYMVGYSPVMKIMLFMVLLSLGGLPPLLGFLPKWIIIQTTLSNNLSFITTALITSSLITLYYYLRICYSSFMISYTKPKWNKWSLKIFPNKINSMLSTLSLIGMVICTTLINSF
uniref:NADH dehydrogenase subunit 2 n=1 Tax=Eucorydia linglong TaxID=3037041 RepID=UPI00279EAA4F|nr:NADH dehydrogenase subunit 2 [Eucorydia linglong]WGO57808.1 NADH dehydrogenase subunit 2 [Eucorydia linglong]